MSRIGKKPIAIPAGVKVEIGKDKVKVTGPKGNLEQNRLPGIDLKVDEDAKQVIVSNTNEANKQYRANYGTMRALVNNMVVGTTEGFARKMEIYGTGYNIKEQGGKLVLQVGFCHPVELKMPKSVSVEIKTPATRGNDVPAVFTLSGYNKHELGQFAANVRKVRPPEPYKGKGIRFSDEYVRRKAGKSFASGG
ncbi:50S ribosomal protein L6 [Anaerohalosphaera lusitana]|uniref:Large ribosomal subunit protein uL6 n=1 Tax=Anaerohalosphaera lusitana TaxID=1936003 RepID=A0A1U9NQ43_9BACT|nr:50S ribosomal protein L6 [Anaerohalosphaera lusitana]AQT69838.1 50S ribosomal protein L6 [Anaerohalosphaera lusitana]